MIRKFAALVLLACYGGSALVGPGLHQILGCEHDHSAATAADDHSESQLANLVSADGDHRHGAGHDEHDCPICQLLAMPQSVVANAAHAPVIASVFHRVILSSGPVLAAPPASFLIRGPPAV